MKKHRALVTITLFLMSVPSLSVAQDGLKHTLISKSGALYEGVIMEGSKQRGRGKFIAISGEFEGNKYEGEFLREKFHGQGTMIYADGNRYKGEFKNSNKHGLGTFTSFDGGKYIGEYKDDNFNVGVYYPINGKTQSGYWVDNIFKSFWSKAAIHRYLKSKYPKFSGFDSGGSFPPIKTTVKSSGNSISGFIAVLEFDGNNISSSEVTALTDRLRAELVGSEQLTVIERGKMEEILQEQSFQQSGCVSSECVVEVGKLLGVEQIVSGNISKVGNFFSVTARVVSVTTGEIVRSTIYDHPGDIGSLLTKGMKKVAEELERQNN